MRTNNAITMLVGEELEGGGNKYCGTLAAPNGSVYGIPSHARRVSKFNPVDKSITYIGPDLGNDEWKWRRGAITESGIIYCIPVDSGRRRIYSSRHGILKIDTNTDNVTELDANLLPERGVWMWLSCAAALDGCIYFMPCMARRIMKLDPNNNDAMTSVGVDLGDGEWKYSGMVVGIDGCVYGMPNESKRILKYDPINEITYFVGVEADEDFACFRNAAALGRDGCIYAVTQYCRVLKIDTTNNSHRFVGNSIQSDHYGMDPVGDAILGIDGCIYWPPENNSSRILKYDPHSGDKSSHLGDDFGNGQGWSSGALVTGGVIY